MFFTVYKTTNNVNGKIYVGVHKTNDLNGDYLGSGKLLKRAIEKYGIESFTREYIKVFDNEEDMFNMESEIVNEEFVLREDTYNIIEGGHGGWSFINSNGLNPAFDIDRQRSVVKKAFDGLQHKRKTDPEFCEKMRKICSENMKKAHREGKIKYGTFNGKTHTEEAKRKIGKAASKHQQGTQNSQYGTCWIYNEELKENKKIKKEDLDSWLEQGWIKGRKKKEVITSICETCGKEVKRGNNRCVQCSHVSQQKLINLTKEYFEHLIWDKNMSLLQISKLHKVSWKTVKNKCIKLNVKLKNK